MHSRLTIALPLCLMALAAPVAASQPEGYAAKLLSNPLTVYTPAPEAGLPPIVTGGFRFWDELGDLDAGDTLTLQLALIPFRSHPTSVRLFDSSGRQMLFLPFHDGAVLGLPYDRSQWNDVEVEMRIAAQEFELTVNGMRSGPFPLCDTDPGADPCTSVSRFELRGDFLDEDTGWVDSISLVRDAGGSPQSVFELQYESCAFYRLSAGGILILDPPRNLHAGGKAGPVGGVSRMRPETAR